MHDDDREGEDEERETERADVGQRPHVAVGPDDAQEEVDGKQAQSPASREVRDGPELGEDEGDHREDQDVRDREPHCGGPRLQPL